MQTSEISAGLVDYLVLSFLVDNNKDSAQSFGHFTLLLNRSCD